MLQVTVMPDGDRWKVRHNFYNKFYPARGEALLAAVDIAHAAALLHNDAEVLMHQPGGDHVVVWLAGRDPYPPPASLTAEPD